jgi:hypothetical protein
MGLISKAMAIGRHAYLFPEGLAAMMANVTGNIAIGQAASATRLPHPDDDGWIYAGIIEAWEDSIAEEESKTLWTPSPGHLVRSDIVTTKQALDQKLTTNQMSALAAGLFYRAADVLAEGDFQFVPLGSVPKKFWMMFMDYSHEDTLILSGNVWGQTRCTGGIKGGNGEISMPEFTHQMLYSSLNTMALGAA